MVGGQKEVELKAAALARGEENDQSATVELKKAKKKRKKINFEDNSSRKDIQEILDNVKAVAEEQKAKQLDRLLPEEEEVFEIFDAFNHIQEHTGDYEEKLDTDDLPEQLVEPLIDVVDTIEYAEEKYESTWGNWDQQIAVEGPNVVAKFKKALEAQQIAKDAKTATQPATTAAKH